MSVNVSDATGVIANDHSEDQRLEVIPLYQLR